LRDSSFVVRCGTIPFKVFHRHDTHTSVIHGSDDDHDYWHQSDMFFLLTTPSSANSFVRRFVGVCIYAAEGSTTVVGHVYHLAFESMMVDDNEDGGFTTEISGTRVCLGFNPILEGHHVPLIQYLTKYQNNLLSNNGSLNLFNQSKNTMTSRGIRIDVGAIAMVENDRIGLAYSMRMSYEGQDGDDRHDDKYDEEKRAVYVRLVSRHLRFTNLETNEVNNVDGEGVIGQYPSLWPDGSHLSDWPSESQPRQRHVGCFCYESCSGTLEDTRIGGFLLFQMIGLQGQVVGSVEAHIPDLEMRREGMSIV
jgi:uncharacterized protein affecting Mg2+/Co2+ transport